MKMRVKLILDFLSELRENNNREWFQLHKPKYEEAKNEMLKGIADLIREISVFDSDYMQLEPKQCLFRIYRDVRFGKNKDPYKTNMGGFMVKGGRKSGNAGYYLHLEPGNSFVGGGIYGPDASNLKAIRQEIAYEGDVLLKILKANKFKKYFSQIQGDSLVRPPKGFDPESKYIDYLKMKSFTVLYPLNEEILESDHFIEQIVPTFEAMRDFNNFLNRSFQS
jgi:uncharacterized protein (TIGR02453 family)